MQQNQITEQLRKFAPEIASFGHPLASEFITEFETLYGIQLPDDYKNILQLINGFSIMGNEVYGIGPAAVTLPLENVYQFEHYEVAFPQPFYLIPVSPDGGGNFYCFDTRRRTNEGKSCAVVFWVSNYNYTEEDPPAEVYGGFTEFVQEVIIDWTLEEYDYEGNEK